MLQPDYVEMIHGNIFPAVPFERQLFYRDDLHIWFIYNGAAWIDLQAPGMVVHGNLWHAPAFATEAALLAHIAATALGIHGSSVAAVINTLMHRDAAGRAQIANPAAALDIDNLGSRIAAIAAHAALPTIHQDAPAIAAALIAVHAALPTVHQDAPALIAVHAALTTGVHGVGTGTIASVSTANKIIYVDKEATGAGDGTSWADAFTTIQDAVDSMEDIIIHAYTISIRDGTKKTGTADANILNKLHDTGEFPAATVWAGRRVFNVSGTGPGNNWGVVSARGSDDQLSIVDIAGAPLDLFPNGNEDYVIEPTPYRETIYLNSDPASYPAHLVLGSVTIEAEHYWYGDCEVNVNVGEIKDTTADFSNVELGDRVFALDLNGANNRAQDYEVGTVDDISQIGAGIVRTNLTKTPTTNWVYVIVKTEISGSDDGTDGGTARDYCFNLAIIDKVVIDGFYFTFSDDAPVLLAAARYFDLLDSIIEDCDRGVNVREDSYFAVSRCFFETTVSPTFLVGSSKGGISRLALTSTNSDHLFVVDSMSRTTISYSYLDNGNRGAEARAYSYIYLYRNTISGNVATGIYARYNSAVRVLQNTNNAIIPEDPAGTVEGAYIG